MIWKRMIRLFLGILIMALGTAICNHTGLGIDPFNAFCSGGAARLSVSLGTFTLLAQMVLAMAALIMNRRYLGAGSVIPMVFFGYFLQFFNWFLSGMLPEPHGFFAGVAGFLPGMLVIVFGMSIYMDCNLGMVPYDSLSFLLSERTGINAFVVRVIVDVSCAVLALLVGGPISVGTVLLAFGVGPLLNLAGRCKKAVYGAG